MVKLQLSSCFDTQLLNKVEQLFYQFLWDGKPDKIKRRVIIGPVSKGDWKMMDVKMQSDAVKLGQALESSF